MKKCTLHRDFGDENLKHHFIKLIFPPTTVDIERKKCNLKKLKTHLYILYRGGGTVFGLGKQTVNGFFENENFGPILFSEF